HMARLGLQRQAEAEIALEFGSDLGAISDGSPVVRDDHGSFVQGLHRADLVGVKSLNQRRDDAFGFSGERIGLGHCGLLFMLMLVDLRCGLCRGGGAATRGWPWRGRERPFRQRGLYAAYARRLPQGDPGGESWSPCQWRAHGLSTANTNFPRVWPATPRSNA